MPMVVGDSLSDWSKCIVRDLEALVKYFKLIILYHINHVNNPPLASIYMNSVNQPSHGCTQMTDPNPCRHLVTAAIEGKFIDLASIKHRP